MRDSCIVEINNAETVGAQLKQFGPSNADVGGNDGFGC